MAAITAPYTYTNVAWVQQGSTTLLRITPRGTQDFTRPPVVYLHGGQLTNSPGTPGSPFAVTLRNDMCTTTGSLASGQGLGPLLALLAAGYRVYAPYTGPNWCATTCTYPGSTGTGGITDALTKAVADGHPSNRVLLFGGSMGGGNAFSWALSNSSKVTAAYTASGLVDVVDAHARSLGLPLSGSIEAQWTSSYATTCLGVNPTSNTGSWTSGLQSKFKCVWGTDDATVPYATSSVFAAALPSLTAVFLSGFGHFTFLDTGWDDFDCVRWFDAAIGRTH